MIRVSIADDHRLVRRGIKEILRTAADIVCCGEAANGEELLPLLRSDAPDVLILDMSMPGLSGTELIQQLADEFPRLRILVLSMHNEGQFAARAIRAGASGYVTKDADPEILLKAVRSVAADGRFVDPALVEAMMFDPSTLEQPPHESLTEREIQVLRAVAAGKSLNSIAGEFHLSPKTISSHKIRLMQKLGIDSNADLVRYAIRHGLAPV